MYGSVFQFKAKAGADKQIEELFNTSQTAEGERLRKAGMRASYVFKLDQGGYIGVAIFESKEQYVANANDPAQDQWYRRFRELLEADPQWNDGEVTAVGAA
jgi:hypothetical protein